MLKITQIKIPVGEDNRTLEDKLCSALRIKPSELISFSVKRRSIEARKKHRLSFVYTVHAEVKNEDAVLLRARGGNITKAEERSYGFPKSGSEQLSNRPVIIGSGPAGLFCAYFLSKQGYSPIVLERGQDVEARSGSVEAFWAGGKLNTESNVQFGEGGAGTFSDGKLYTGVSDKQGRNSEVLRLFVKYGAPKELLYDANPHIGTDILKKIVKNIRKAIIAYGGEFLFETKAEEIIIEEGRIRGVRTKDDFIDTDVCVAAIGHSARDTFYMLQKKGVRMEPKAFAVGTRIQHPQSFINEAQWGKDAPKELGAASYKAAVRLSDGRGAYTFCMCPGGYVINASSEEGRLAVNGMSYSGRASGYANSALIVTVSPADFLSYAAEDLPYELSGIAFQRNIEERAFRSAMGRIPIQTFSDFKSDIVSNEELIPCVKGEWERASLKGIFPEFVAEGLKEGIEKIGNIIIGFDMPTALLIGAESRTSSPVRILRDKGFESNVKGLYPCGEGAGYAGGISSSAIDGIRIAEAIAKKYEKIN